MPLIIVFAIVGGLAQFVDGSLGMGFGITSATLLTCWAIPPWLLRPEPTRPKWARPWSRAWPLARGQRRLAVLLAMACRALAWCVRRRGDPHQREPGRGRGSGCH